jgi:UDP-glucose 4-epimerase
MKVGITGAGGFIGRPLAAALHDSGASLVLVDQVAHPTLPTIPRDYAAPESLAALADCDVVVHLAAVPGVIACEKDPVGSRRTNIVELAALVDAVEARGIPLLFASTFSVLGEPAVQPITWTTPYSPLNEYARHKVAGEMLVRSLRQRGFILRMSNVYGPYTLGGTTYRKGNVITLYCEQARQGTLRIHEPGTQARDFIHIEDVVTHWRAAIEYARRPAPRTHLLHVAGGEMWSVLGIAEEIRRNVSRPLTFERVPNPRTESIGPEFQVEVAPTRQELGVTIHHNVRTTIIEELRAREVL